MAGPWAQVFRVAGLDAAEPETAHRALLDAVESRDFSIQKKDLQPGQETVHGKKQPVPVLLDNLDISLRAF